MKERKKKMDDDVFVGITNKELYSEVKQGFKEIKDKIEIMCVSNDHAHDEIIKRQDISNGKIKLNRWVATTALALITTLIFLLLARTTAG